MNTLMIIILLWQMVLGVSVISGVIGILTKSWIYMLISFITSLPVSFIFLGSSSLTIIVKFIPLLLLLLTIVFWKEKRRRACHT
ncbi:hypothetical protein [Bacillus solimangrovi]|uniref:hypothetical protein n=1 Tax=Bacillus solimangrovi TaxID=1305675 RepID=UPI0011130069|nr:hypothetical protein [Bacillus solimangrovi]